MHRVFTKTVSAFIEDVDSIRISLLEMITNAIEHGNLNISYTEKQQAIRQNTLPELYAKMVEINREIDLIHTEVARLETLSSEYPQQKNIINAEKVIWEKTLKSLFSVLQNFEKNIDSEVYYLYNSF